MIPKPQSCNQDWLKMEKIDGGRICGKCQHKMVDFTKMSWNEIEQVHAKNPGQCGMYSKKQLKHWGYEPPSVFSECSKVALFFSSLFAGMSVQSADAKPLNIQKEAIHFSPIELKNDSIPEKFEADKIITLRGKIIDDKTKEPIQASIVALLSPNNRVVSNSEGFFEIRVLDNAFFKINVLRINTECHHVREVDTVLFEDNSLTISMTRYTKEDFIKIETIQNSATYFGVPKPSLSQRIKNCMRY